MIKVYYNSYDAEYKSPFGAVEKNKDIKFTIKTNKKVSVELITDSENGKETFKLKNNEKESELYAYSIIISTNEYYGSIFYYFKLIDEDNNTFYYGNNKENLGGEGLIYSNEPLDNPYQVTIYDINYKVPSWYDNGIIYHIFIDRFNDENENLKSIENLQESYGGTIKGITQKLDYLQSLNVDILYLTPIFKSNTYHKYHIEDYKAIDTDLGTINDLKELINEAKKRDMHIIFDFVFNHCGANSIYFNKYGNYPELGAYQSKESKYYTWFTFKEYPDDYLMYHNEMIGQVPELPKLNTDNNPSFLNYMLYDKDSVLKYWLKYGMDGIRIDAANFLSDEFLSKIFDVLKKEKGEDSVIMGELWQDATNIHYQTHNCYRKYMVGNEIESVTNYPLHGIITEYCLGKTAEYFRDHYYSLIENFPMEYFKSTQNFLTTHDIPRIYTILNEDINLLNLAVGFLFTLPGVPTIFYGDETGLKGGSDPENRLPLPWKNIDENILDIYKKFANIYAKNDSIKKGDIHFIKKENNNLLIYKRRYKDEEVYIVANNSNYVEIDLNERFINLLSNKKVENKLKINKNEIFILKKD